MDFTENTITLCGWLDDLPQPSHENHQKQFVRFLVRVPRLSGTEDVLPVIAPQSLWESSGVSPGQMLRIRGQIRSHNQRENGRRHLLVFVFATALDTDCSEAQNEVRLQGPLCRQPTLRRTPLGREICDCMVAIPRAYHRADYLPCILWGRTAQEIAACHTSDIIAIQGRLQSRTYTKQTDQGMQEHTTYEISALSAQIAQEPL